LTPVSKTTKPLSRASKYILSTCNKTLFNAVFDQLIDQGDIIAGS
jgi:hypothetical protein